VRFKLLVGLALLSVGCASPRISPPPAAPPVNTPELAIVSDAAADTLLRDVRTLAPEIVVELRYATSHNFTGAPIPGYEGNRAYLRREAAPALARVEEALKSRGLGLKVYDAYRPVRATLAMVEWTKRVNREDLLRDGYIASRSRHNLGLAIDLTLIRLADSSELAMGTPFDTFSEAAHTANATGEARANRQILKSAMEREGFLNYDQEWWHFSYSVPDPVRFDRVIR
jgi:zinc D-Ala-D-Ala dipeptidase